MNGAEFGVSIGLSTWAAFSGSPDHAVVDGDFAMTADEVQPVMRTLRDAGIHIVALHFAKELNAHWRDIIDRGESQNPRLPRSGLVQPPTMRSSA